MADNCLRRDANGGRIVRKGRDLAMQDGADFTPAELDEICAEFDRSDPLVQRKLVATLMVKVMTLERKLEDIAKCPECGGSGSRWYAGRGTESCIACRGTGKKR